ncbi:transposase [Streptomyces erythrochromogenes]|uniref:transposase n=1 Tax=Streptomyces erythrochromogenes TaxID=285574 RepID=UPI0036FD2B56
MALRHTVGVKPPRWQSFEAAGSTAALGPTKQLDPLVSSSRSPTVPGRARRRPGLRGNSRPISVCRCAPRRMAEEDRSLCRLRLACSVPRVRGATETRRGPCQVEQGGHLNRYGRARQRRQHAPRRPSRGKRRSCILGRSSPGVARQYSGTLGKVGNCQIGVSVHAASDTASCPLSWRLFLPAIWDGPDAEARRRACRIPDSVHTTLSSSLGGQLSEWTTSRFSSPSKIPAKTSPSRRPPSKSPR